MFGWNARAASVAWTVGLVAIGFCAVYAIRKTLLIFVLALLFAYMIAPLVGLIERHMWRRIPRGASVFVAALVVFGLLALMVALVAPSLAEEARKLAAQLPGLSDKSALAHKIPLPSWLDPLRGRIEAFAQSAMASAVPFAKSAGTEIFSYVGNAVFFVLIPILAIIFVNDGAKIRSTLLRELEPSESRQKLVDIIADLHDALGKYVRALGLLSLATLVSYGTFFASTGVPYALLLAALAAVFEIVPVVGPLAAAGIALFVAGVSGYDHLLWIAGFVLAYRIFQDYVLSPMLMHGSIGVHPALVIFGLLAGEQLGGVAGIFLSIPVIASIIIVDKNLRGHRTLKKA